MRAVTAFHRIMEFVLAHEGGYVDHPDDPGGETNFGISKRSHPDLDIKSLTREGAKEIYREGYWATVRGESFPACVSLTLLDYAIHSGPSMSAKALQEVVSTKQDGRIGPKTIEATATLCAAIGARSVAQKHNRVRVEHLVRLASSRHSMRPFLLGWMYRLTDMAAEIEREGV